MGIFPGPTTQPDHKKAADRPDSRALLQSPPPGLPSTAKVVRRWQHAGAMRAVCRVPCGPGGPGSAEKCRVELG